MTGPLTTRKISKIWLKDALIISVVLALFLGLVGPFGDYAVVPIELRVFSWIVFGIGGFITLSGQLYLVDRFKPDWSWRLSLLGTTLIGALFLTPVVIFFDLLIVGDVTIDFVATYPMVLGVAAVNQILFELSRQARIARTGSTLLAESATHQTSQVPRLAQAPKILRRLPPHLMGQLICLTKEDHYLRVYTDKGDSLIRLRMSDAVDELEGIGGLQTHRSWWIANDAVVSVRRRPDGGGEVKLSNDLIAPISRARMTEAKTAGWFD